MAIWAVWSNAARRVRRYSVEATFCLRIGADAWSRAALLLATIRYHAGNRLRLFRQSAPHQYRIRLGHRAVDVCLRVDKGDLGALYGIFLDGAYDTVRKVIPPGSVHSIIDLGAHIGLSALYWAWQFPDARLVCVEPNPANVRLLRRNLAWLGDRARILEAAVSDRSGKSWFRDGPSSLTGHLVHDGVGDYHVQCLTLEEIIARCGLDAVDLLKVDIEGAEVLIFSPSNHALGRTRFIAVEFHGSSRPLDETRMLEAAGFRVLAKSTRQVHRMMVGAFGRVDHTVEAEHVLQGP